MVFSQLQTGTPWWWDGTEKVQPQDELPAKTDILIIGGGYTGLSAAIAAHDCGASVVVVDADEPGAGASTRNGGMFGAHPRLGWSTLAKSFGEETADALFAEANPALTWVKRLIEHENIECDLQNTGRISLAWTKQHFETYKQTQRDVLAKTDIQCEIIPRDQLREEIGTEQYYGGMLFPEHCAIHPKKFHTGLLRAVLDRGIPVVPQCLVEQLDRSGGHRARTTKGMIVAQKVILATGGYTTRNFRWHQARVFPLPSYIIATEELPENLIGHLAPGRRMMVESRARHSYYRVSPDGKRILYGGRAAMVNIPLAQAAERLRATMLEVWPDLAETQITHCWRGNTGYSFGHMPNVGAHDGIYHAIGFSGSGTVMAPYLGAKAAYQACDDPRGETAYSKTDLPLSWLHPAGRPHFLQAADLWYRHWVDRWETRAGRMGKGRSE